MMNCPHGSGYEWQEELPITGVCSLTPGKKLLIAGVKVRRLPVIPDERGLLTEILRVDDPEFTQFGQVYVTATYPEVVKGWHYHKHQTDIICCLVGELKLALYDTRAGSPTEKAINEIFIGEANRLIVKVPKEIHHGWKAIGGTTALVLNIPDRVYVHHAPDELRIDPHHNDIPYDWSRRDG